MKLYVIKTRRMANDLIKHGFNIKEIDRNRDDRTKDIYLFEDTEELRESITKITDNINKNK